MARKGNAGEVNKSAEIRELIRQNPEIAVSEAISRLAERGIVIIPSMFYFNKGKLLGKRGRRGKARRMVEKVTATMTSNGAPPTKTGDVVATILKVKHLASEVGGLKKLQSLVEALE